MKNTRRYASIGVLGAAAWLLAGTVNSGAQDQPPQGPGNFDPAQMRQRMEQQMRERFEVTDDGDWKLISERINKVMEARRAGGGFGGPGGFGGGFMRPPGGQGGPGGPPGSNQQDAGGPPPQGGGPGGGGFGPGPGGPGGLGFARQASPEVEALRKAIESKASAQELKARMADVQAARAKNQATLKKAQQDLRDVLSVRQEAIAVSMGLLN